MKVRIRNGDLEVEFEGSAKDWEKVKDGIHLESIHKEEKEK